MGKIGRDKERTMNPVKMPQKIFGVSQKTYGTDDQEDVRHRGLAMNETPVQKRVSAIIRKLERNAETSQNQVVKGLQNGLEEVY
jgi:hypothetical protein